MSEYQYYEFRAIDRPLTDKQMAELRQNSSRADISRERFVNTYNWGDFRGDPRKWMEDYFDASLYVSNWGVRWLMLRVPKRLVDLSAAKEYGNSDVFSWWEEGDHLILSFHSDAEDADWEDGEGWLASIVPVRSDLMQGDHRCLCLGWLLSAQAREYDDDTIEPPVPPGLGELNAPLKSLADFLRIDDDLIAAAAEASEPGTPARLSADEIAGWLVKLPSKEKDAILAKLLLGEEPHIAEELRNRALREVRTDGKSDRQSRTSPGRTVGELFALADEMEDKRLKREAIEKERARIERERVEAEARKKHLESLVGKESALWSEVDQLIAGKNASKYDAAVRLLKDLRDLATMKGKISEYVDRISALRRAHERSRALMDRFQKAGL
jgi:hypothetical protein